MNDLIDETVNDIQELIAKLDTEGNHNFITAPLIIKAHLSKIIKDRTAEVSGDMNHLSIEHFINETFAEIDKPRNYDFQEENHYEKRAINYLERFVPYMMNRDVTKEQVEKAVAGEAWLVLGPQYDSKCYDCGCMLMLGFKGNHIKLKGEKECTHNRVHSIEIDFPTGEVVFDDWPDRFGEIVAAGFIDDKDFEINYLHGRRQKTDHMGAQQIYFHSVGNSCPSLFYNKDEAKIQIGGGQYDEETDEILKPEGFEDVGSFCTDLWWTTMVDRKFYDILTGKLGERKNKHYTKELNIAYIKPGRYRFTCYAIRRGVDGDDSSGMPYATAEWIGEASDFVPEYEMLDSNSRLMTLEEAVAKEFKQIDWQGKPYHPDTAKFRILDQYLNTNGNGMRNKGEFYKHLKVSKDTVFQAIEALPEAVVHYKNPYPNFRQEYSLIGGNVKIEDVPTDWLEGGRWFYQKCAEYFAGDAQDYSYAYPGNKTPEGLEKDNQSFLKAFEDKRKPDMTEEQFHAVISEQWGTPYDGDLHKFRAIKWENEKAKCNAFCQKMIDDINAELDKRV